MQLKEIPDISLSAVKRKDRAGWLALFANDAVLEDPVGVSHLDATGKGHHGIAAIAKFYDDVIEKNETFDYEIHRRFAGANEPAVFCTFKITLPGGMRISIDLVIVYKQNAEGKLESLRAFWEPDQAVPA